MELTVAIFSIIFSAIAIGVSYYTFRKTQETGVRPILVFSNYGKDEMGNDLWYIINAGNGPAINILITGGDKEFNWKEEECVLLPAIAKEETQELNWLRTKQALIATYENANGKTYTTICVNNRNKISEGNPYSSLEPKHYKWQLYNGKMISKPSKQLPQSLSKEGKSKDKE